MELFDIIVNDGWFAAADVPSPASIIVTLEAACNLKCLHCCWSHDEQQGEWLDWSPYIDQIAERPNAHITYAGRMLTPRSAAVIKKLCSQINRQIEIVDHGYTITKYPDLYQHFSQVNISLDGINEDHDRQRQRPGAAQVAWNAIDDLRVAGLDPVVAACVSPLNIDRWSKFEEKLAAHNVSLSCSPIYQFRPTAQRGMSFFDEFSLQAAFEMLLGGIPKNINLYQLADVMALMPILRQGSWFTDSDVLVGKFPNRITVFYQPLCIARLSSRELRWDGRWLMPPDVELDVEPENWPQQLAQAANHELAVERRYIKKLLRGG